MSTIEAILAGSERVKDCTSKTKWKQCSLALTRDSPYFSVTRILRRMFVTLYRQKFQ